MKGGALEHACFYLRPPMIGGRDPDVAGHVKPASQPLIELRESQHLFEMLVCLLQDDVLDELFRHAHAEDGEEVHFLDGVPRLRFPPPL